MTDLIVSATHWILIGLYVMVLLAGASWMFLTLFSLFVRMTCDMGMLYRAYSEYLKAKRRNEDA